MAARNALARRGRPISQNASLGSRLAADAHRLAQAGPLVRAGSAAHRRTVPAEPGVSCSPSPQQPCWLGPPCRRPPPKMSGHRHLAGRPPRAAPTPAGSASVCPSSRSSQSKASAPPALARPLARSPPPVLARCRTRSKVPAIPPAAVLRPGTRSAAAEPHVQASPGPMLTHLLTRPAESHRDEVVQAGTTLQRPSC
jgi:hypothetical protein